jgi:toxin CptA
MATAPFLIALAAIGFMGFAAQRGGTCTVAAIEEIVAERRFGRLVALIEASLWVGGGLVLLNAAGLLVAMPVGYAAGLATVAGGVLLGVGAIVNGSCAFGSIARLGSGDWAYLATPVGFFLGSLAIMYLPAPVPLAEGSIVLAARAWLAVLCMLLFAALLFAHGRAVRRRGIAPLAHIWSSHTATTIIGLTSLVASVTVGPWSFTETLSGLARGMMFDLTPRLLLFVALLTGALLGGWTAGRLRLVAPNAASISRCLAGGAMMGIGGALIPGGNDSLILIGMPLLLPYAWMAFVSMCVAIYVAIRLTGARRVLQR